MYANVPLNRPILCGQHKKGPQSRKKEVLRGEATRTRRLSSLHLDAHIVIKIDKIADQFRGLLKRIDFLPVNTLGF